MYCTVYFNLIVTRKNNLNIKNKSKYIPIFSSQTKYCRRCKRHINRDVDEIIKRFIRTDRKSHDELSFEENRLTRLKRFQIKNLRT